MGNVMGFLYLNDSVAPTEMAAGSAETPAAETPAAETPTAGCSRPLAYALIQAIIYEKNQYKAANLPKAEYWTKYCLARLERHGEIDPIDLNDRYEHSDKALFIKQKNSAICLKQTILTLAARYSSPALFLRCLSHPKINPNVTDDEGNTPLHIAASLGRMDIVSYLVKDKRTKLKKTDANGMTALHLSRIHNHVDIEELLMKVLSEQTEACGLAHLRSNTREQSTKLKC